MIQTLKQTWLIRTCIVAPMLATSGYHAFRNFQSLPTISLLLFLVAAALILLSLWAVERKYEYKLPSMTDICSYAFAFLLIGGVNFWIEYNVHSHDKFHEALSSLLSLFGFLPFMLFVGQKKSIPFSEVSHR